MIREIKSAHVVSVITYEELKRVLDQNMVASFADIKPEDVIADSLISLWKAQYGVA